MRPDLDWERFQRDSHLVELAAAKTSIARAMALERPAEFVSDPCVVDGKAAPRNADWLACTQKKSSEKCASGHNVEGDDEGWAWVRARAARAHNARKNTTENRPPSLDF